MTTKLEARLSRLEVKSDKAKAVWFSDEHAAKIIAETAIFFGKSKGELLADFVEQKRNT